MNQLGPDFIEHIHDVLVGVFLPFDEKVNPAEYRSRSLIESAAARPFQTACGFEVWPTLAQKAAALFHSLACNHCFINGNKRTAVIALDIFLMINDHLLTMTPDEVYELAKATATANQNGRDTDTVLSELSQKVEQAAFNTELLLDPQIQERLGMNLEKIVAHVARSVEFSRAVIQAGSVRAR